ncbi:MAG: DUF3035 domain-containing protein [Alphaproteobacteria bacterium]|nr:DUF3035 domain-containing protein [Alphaproteobacteria bacterium]
MKNAWCSRYLAIALLGCSLIITTSCSSNVTNDVRNTLGLNKDAPDEFAVRTRAPLEIPKTLTLLPPQPGMQRPQEKTAVNTAKEAVFGEDTVKQAQKNGTSKDNIEAVLLEKSGADKVSDNIRNLVDQETQKMTDRNKPVATKLLNLASGEKTSAATIVDAKAEYERIKKNLEEGKSVLEGETPMIDN